MATGHQEPAAAVISAAQTSGERPPPKTEENSRAIGRPELTGDAFRIGFYEMAFAQILWSQNETRLMPNPLRQAPTPPEAATVALGKMLFTNEVSQGGAGWAGRGRQEPCMGSPLR